MTETQKKIVDLRKRGLTHRQISERVGVSLPYINMVCIRLIREGVIEARESRRQPDPAVAKRNDRIAQLHRQGMPSGKIAKKLGINRDIVYGVVSILRAQGKLPKHPFHRGRKPAKKKKTAAKRR